MSLKMNASMERLANEIRICQKERETLADLLAAVSGEDQKVQLIKIQAHEPLFKELMELRASTQDAEDILEEKEEVETMSQMLEDLVDLTGADDDADIYPAIQVMKSEFYRELDDMPAGYTERRPNFFDGV